MGDLDPWKFYVIFVCKGRQATNSMKYMYYFHFLLKTKNKILFFLNKKTWGGGFGAGAGGNENLTINFYWPKVKHCPITTTQCIFTSLHQA